MDRRIRQSESKLKDAFIRLMGSRDPAEISVKALCMEAGLNRSTFYDRFGYMERLVECIIKDCLDDVCAGNKAFGAEEIRGKYVPREDIRRYIDGFLSNRTLMAFCRSRARERYYYQIIKTQVVISMRSIQDQVAYYPAFFQNSGVLELLFEWINNGRDVPEEQIVEIIHEFSKSMYINY